MKNLIFTRHAKARERDWVTKDLERPLRGRGTEQSQSIGRQLKEINNIPDIIYSSPSLRTLETAEYMHSEFGQAVNIQVEKSIYEADNDDILELIHGLDPILNTVLFVMHNPCITDLAYHLCPWDEKIFHLRCAETFIIEIDSYTNFRLEPNESFKLLKP